MARPSKQEVDDLRKQAPIDAAYEASMRNTPPAPARPASAPVVKKAKGGSVSASRRADGIASKGKTRGKMC